MARKRTSKKPKKRCYLKKGRYVCKLFVKPRRRGLRGEIEQTELRLYVDNEERFYRRRLAVRAALARKVCRGSYDASKAAKAFVPMLTEAAKSYGKEYASGPKEGLRTFSTTDRRAVAADMASDFIRDVKNGYDLSPEERKNLTSCARRRKEH